EEQALLPPAQEGFPHVPTASLPAPTLLPASRAEFSVLLPPRLLPPQMQTSACPALPLSLLPANVLSPDLPHGLPRPPSPPQPQTLPVPRFGSGSSTELAQSPPEPSLHGTQVPQDRSPLAPPESQPARPAAGELVLPARRDRDLRGPAQHAPSLRADPDRDEEPLPRLGRVSDDPSSRQDDPRAKSSDARGRAALRPPA